MRFTSGGLIRQNRNEILEQVKGDMRRLFGYDLSFEEGSVANLLASFVSEYELRNQKLIEEVYESRKLESAEDVFLDDILNRFGLYRFGPRQSSGNAVVRWGRQADPSHVIPSAGTKFQASNGKTYTPSREVMLRESISGLKLSTDDLIAPTDYLFRVYDAETQDYEENTFQLTSNQITAKYTMLNEMRDWLKGVVAEPELVITTAPDSNEAVLWVGFDSPDVFSGLTNSTEMTISPQVGEWYTTVPVISEEAGYAPLPRGGIRGVSPTFLGYLGALNARAFNPGANTETDAEYKMRWYSEGSGSAPKGTRDGIFESIMEVEGVINAKLIVNKTDEPLYIDGELAATKFSFNSIVAGGDDFAIAEAIYKSKPIDTATFGNTSEEVDTADEDKETIWFTRPEEESIGVRVRYRTRLGNSLTTREEELVTEALIESVRGFGIGETVYAVDLESVVVKSLEDRRLSSVEARLFKESSPTVMETEITPSFKGVLRITSPTNVRIEEL